MSAIAAEPTYTAATQIAFLALPPPDLVLVNGVRFSDVPEDLYIPPDALAVLLETFEGPLDLLLYLIKKHNVDILDIPIAKITKQYLMYIDWMQTIRLELAADYLVMAATLAEIKSQVLLPQPETPDEGEEADPRAELVRRLQEYERFKQAAQTLHERPQLGREWFDAQVAIASIPKPPQKPQVDISDLVEAFQAILKRTDLAKAHQVLSEPLSLRARMSDILEQLQSHTDEAIPFTACFTLKEGRPGVVVSFIAILELLKAHLVDIVQSGPYAPIYVRAVTHDDN